jgi:hypothetical protein
MRSSEDSRALDPQIKRGVEDVAVPPPSPPSIKSRPTKPQVSEPASEIKLKLDASDIRKLQSSAETSSQTKSTELSKLKSKTLSEYRPFTRNATQARIGSPDLLPNVRDGEITLLNAKADVYAVFVRRVALKVFTELRHKSWSDLSYQMARSTSKFSTVRATMSPEGKLLRVQLIDSSGNSQFDQLLNQSATSGTWDQNPPIGARAADGQIHFIFKSKTWAERYGDRSIERRWLLLATGLE